MAPGDPATAERREAQGGSFLRSAGIVSSLTFLSRLLGLVREQAFAALLGAGPYADAFQIAFRIPNLLRDLFAEGALSAAFVPTYARARAEEGPGRAHEIGSRLMSLLAVVLSLLVLAGTVLAWPLVRTLAPGFEAVEGKGEVTVLLTRVMLPFLPLVSFAAVAMGMLNAQERFGVPALAPSMFNVVAIVWAGLLWACGIGPREVAIGWAVGTLLGGTAQFLVQVPALRRTGWRFRPEWAPADPALRRIGVLMAPATLGLAAVQVNIFVSSAFASHEPGAVSWLNYAFRILYLPIGIFGVAVGTIATTGLSRRAAEGDMEGLRETLRRSLRLLAFLTVPATVGLAVLGVPIVRLLYERGRFDAADTRSTAAALALYSLGLVAYTAVKVLAPAFYALGRPRLPLLGSATAVAVNVLTMFALYDRLGFRSVALGTALGSVANTAILLAAFQSSLGGLSGHGLGGVLARMGLAAGTMGVGVHLLAELLEGAVGTRGLLAQLATGLVPVAAGAALYLAAAWALGLGEVRSMASLFRRR